MNIIELHKNAVIELCKKHHVKTLCVFGSALGDDFNDESDVDFSVVFDGDILKDPIEGGQNSWNFIESLEKEFNRRVDLVFENSIRNRFFKMELDLTKKLLYAA